MCVSLLHQSRQIAKSGSQTIRQYWQQTPTCRGLKGLGGFFCQNHMWLYLPNLKNLTFSIPIFSPNYSPINRKAVNFTQIGCFLQQFGQNTPDLCHLGSFFSDENPLIASPNFMKKHPKRQAQIQEHPFPRW